MWLSRWIQEYRNLEYYHWVILLKRSSQAIGTIHLNEINNEDNSVSIHYLLSRKDWNHGFMMEACGAVLGFAFGKLNVKKVHAYHHIDNPASGSVLKKSGFHFLHKQYRSVPDCENISGEYLYYEITDEDWRQRL